MPRMDRRIDGAWGWVVTAAVFVLLFLAYGNAYTFGVFFPALAAEFDADRADTALVFSVLAALYSTLATISGPAADRFGTRAVCGFGMVAMAAGLAYASTAQALWQVYLGFGLGVALGIGCNFAPASAGLQRWVTRRRGLASGLSSTGVGVSVLVLPPLVAALIDWRDWRAAMLTLAALSLVFGVASAALMGDPPGTRRDRNEPPAATRFDLRRALASRGFVAFHLSSTCACIGIFIPFVHLVTYATDRGFDEATGVLLIAVIGVASLVGRVVLTVASDRLGRRASIAVIYAAMGASFVLWWWGGSVAVLTVFAVLFGVSYGGYVGMIAPIIAEYFGTERIGSVLGCFMSSVALGGFFGPWFAGHAYDLWGSYDVPLLLAGGFGLLAALFALAMPSRPYAASTFHVAV
ncbi:MAG: MFS transporter [Alphaproteobacteria bacterium]